MGRLQQNSKRKTRIRTGKRIRQGILVVPTTRVFDFLGAPDKIDMTNRVGHCGDGYEHTEKRFNREMINIPLMMGEFLIEKEISCKKGVMAETSG